MGALPTTTWVRNQLELRRAVNARRSKTRRRRLPRPPRMLRPAAVERTYQRELLAFVARAKGLVDKILIPALPGILAGASAHRPTLDADLIADDEVSKLLQLIRSGLFGSYSDGEIAAMTERIARAVAAQNAQEVGKVFRDVLGVELFQSEPWLQKEMQGFVAENVSLITSIADQYLAQVQGIVYAGARQGQASGDVADQIGERFGVTQSRAELIASDQIGKFNGQLNGLRQKNAGVSRYRWRGALDSRERPEHLEREGQIFSWDDPPEDGNPGEPIRCRCYAEPVLEDLFDEEADDE